MNKDEPVQPIADFRNYLSQSRNFGLIDGVQFSNFGFIYPVYSLNLLIELIDFGSVGVVQPCNFCSVRVVDVCNFIGVKPSQTSNLTFQVLIFLGDRFVAEEYRVARRFGWALAAAC